MEGWPEWAQGSMHETILAATTLIGTAVLVYIIARWGVARAIGSLVRRSTLTWDDALTDARVFRRLAHLAPAVVIFLGISAVPGVPLSVDAVVRWEPSSARPTYLVAPGAGASIVIYYSTNIWTDMVASGGTLLMPL